MVYIVIDVSTGAIVGVASAYDKVEGIITSAKAEAVKKWGSTANDHNFESYSMKLDEMRENDWIFTRRFFL